MEGVRLSLYLEPRIPTQNGSQVAKSPSFLPPRISSYELQLIPTNTWKYKICLLSYTIGKCRVS
jgi:hypothetical protein